MAGILSTGASIRARSRTDDDAPRKQVVLLVMTNIAEVRAISRHTYHAKCRHATSKLGSTAPIFATSFSPRCPPTASGSKYFQQSRRRRTQRHWRAQAPTYDDAQILPPARRRSAAHRHAAGHVSRAWRPTARHSISERRRPIYRDGHAAVTRLALRPAGSHSRRPRVR